MSWQDGVVYQIYPRSFADSDGDGVGDLEGITQRLDHLRWLGVDALWLSPVYPSPLADWGYDVSDYTDIDPRLGSLESFDRLLAEAHDAGPAPADGPRAVPHVDRARLVPRASRLVHLGGLGRQAAEQLDVGIRRARVGARPFHRALVPALVLSGAARPRLAQARRRRGDAGRGAVLDRARGGRLPPRCDRSAREGPASCATTRRPASPSAYRCWSTSWAGTCATRATRPGPDRALAALREAAGEDALLVGEVYLPTARAAPYLEHLDRLFVFELLHATWDADVLRRAIGPAAALRGRPGAAPAWVLSNHDFGRLAHRFGRENERAAAMLLLTLPGSAFVYQGDEIGMGNGPGATPPRDRVGRDSFRHPMQWDGSAGAGFTSGTPWLPAGRPGRTQRRRSARRSSVAAVLV